MGIYVSATSHLLCVPLLVAKRTEFYDSSSLCFAWPSRGVPLECTYPRPPYHHTLLTCMFSQTELLDSFDDKSSQNGNTSTTQAHKEDIGFGHSEFTWSVHAGTEEPSQQSFTLRIEDEVVFKRGALNLVVGPTGSGKTSVLMALLGEMHDIPLGPDAWVNLPRHSGVAYAAQESWVMSDTIKVRDAPVTNSTARLTMLQENILFGSPYDEERYRKGATHPCLASSRRSRLRSVINQCALVPDIRMFKSGDETQVGEKGITLRCANIYLTRNYFLSKFTVAVKRFVVAPVHETETKINLLRRLV